MRSATVCIVLVVTHVAVASGLAIDAPILNEEIAALYIAKVTQQYSGNDEGDRP